MKGLHYIWLILFVIWGLPLTLYRSRFRKIVYQTDSWIINIKPVFIKEVRALFGNLYPGNETYLRFRNFYRFYLIVYLLLFGLYFTYGKSKSSHPMEKVTVGSMIPSFSLPDQHGELFNIDSLLGKQKLVIYFYPKDDSPGCTREACSFRDQFEVFKDAGATIIGISAQSAESHKKFAEKHHLTFTLLSDKGNKVRKRFGVPTSFLGLLPGRVTYVTDSLGRVVYIFNSQVQAEKHVDEALRILKELK